MSTPPAIIAEVADKLARYKAPAQVRVDGRPPAPQRCRQDRQKTPPHRMDQYRRKTRIMAMPTDIGIIDCMLGDPESEHRADWFDSFKADDQGRRNAEAILDARAIYVQGHSAVGRGR